MTALFKTSFAKDLKSIKSKTVLAAVAELIETIEVAQSLQTIPNTKKLTAKENYYRIKPGNYRVGISLTKDEVTFVRCLDRKEIYRYFP